jgi:hypothetical protein
MNEYWTPDELKIIQYWNECGFVDERRKINVELWKKIKIAKQKNENK